MNWPVSEMCAALRVTEQGYCAWKSRPPSAHVMRDEELAELISQVRAEVRNIYGAPKTFMRLRALGVRTSRKRVARIMRERGWRGAARAKRPSGEKRASRRESAADLVGRRFEADDGFLMVLHPGVGSNQFVALASLLILMLNG